MSHESCPHCGAAREQALHCSVCELAYERTAVPTAASPLGRAVQSGRAQIALAATCFAVSMLLPFATVTRLAGGASVSVSPVDMLLELGPFGHDLKSMTMMAIPIAAAAMAQFLFSRTHGRAMLVTRPVLFVLSVLPTLSLMMGHLRLQRGARFVFTLGPASWVVLSGAILGVAGAVVFGRGVPEKRGTTRQNHHDEDEE
ncbi:MAG: hypothetical protein Q8Q09_08025 [Deltaproteobacteria bacterium]|nr:hypothetical protein [Deltaproteobacteria bacterium]